LVVSRCKLLTDASIISIATQCSGLERLSVDWTNLTDKSIISIATHCWDLVCLDVSCCFLLTDKSIKSISSQCTSLKEINLSGCKITDASILSIAIHCPRLQHLDVSGCEQLTDASLIPISINCTSLEILNISHTKLSNEGLCSIAVHCKKLIKLGVSHCSVWNYLSIPWTKESWKSIESLDVSNTDITDRDIRVISENCSRLKSLKADNCVKTTDACFIVLLCRKKYLYGWEIGRSI
jgi:F-box/leucine-rich repeat protein 2/20